MIRRHRITIVVASMLLAAGVSACGNKAEVARARKSLYDADFAVIYSAALDATRDLYPNIDDNPGTGAIKTAWHQVAYANNQDDLSGGRSLSTGAGGGNVATSQAQAQAGMPTRLAYKRFFIRFDVVVAGGRPWRVKIVGHASEWEPGAAMPNELRGPAKPPWLDGRTDALTLAIHKRVKQYAVPMKEEAEPVKAIDLVPKTDPKAFANVPPEAARRLADIKDSTARREYARLRAHVFDDVEWSLGGAPGIETALAMWQADPDVLDEMAKATAACIADGPKRIVCPGGAPVPGRWQLVLELRGPDWKIASFVRAE